MRLKTVVALLATLSLTFALQAQAPDRPVQKAPQKVEPINIVYETPVAGSKSPLIETYVLSKDGLYVPCIIRKPEGAGPFPAILCVHGIPGGRGMSFVKSRVTEQAAVMDRLLSEGYVISYCDFRAGQGDDLVGDPDKATDTADVLAAFEYLKKLPYVDKDRVGIFGVSLGGALGLRVTAATNVTAAVLGAPAAMGVLGYRGGQGEARRDPPASPKEDIPDSEINKEHAMAIINKVSCPILIALGTEDQLLNIGKKLHALLKEAGKPVSIEFYEGMPHGFYWGWPQPAKKEADGTYALSDLYKKHLDDVMTFFNAHMKKKV